MNTTWYKIKMWANKITPVEVINETSKQVVYIDTRYEQQERRAFKVSEGEGFYPTFAEAKAALVAYQAKQVESAEARLGHARAKLATAEMVREA